MIMGASASTAPPSSAGMAPVEPAYADLVQALRPGAADPRSAARSIAALARRDAVAREQLVGHGVLAPLLALLHEGSGDEIKPVATREAGCGQGGNAALRALARDCPANKAGIVDAGAIKPLAQLLQCGSETAQEQAAAALRNLGGHRTQRFVEEGAVAPLVALLGSGSAPGQREQAAAALRNFAAFEDGSRLAIVRAGAVAPLVALLRCRADSTVEEAAAALQNLARHPLNRLAMADAISPLMLVVESATTSDGARDQATAALRNLHVSGVDAIHPLPSGGHVVEVSARRI